MGAKHDERRRSDEKQASEAGSDNKMGMTVAGGGEQTRLARKQANNLYLILGSHFVAHFMAGPR